MAPKFTILTHKIAIQLRLVAEGFTICISRSRQPVRKLLDTPSYFRSGQNSTRGRINPFYEYMRLLLRGGPNNIFFSLSHKQRGEGLLYHSIYPL
jgi:hypothetical protein